MGIGNKVVNCTYSCSRDDNGKGEVCNKNNLKAVPSEDQWMMKDYCDPLYQQKQQRISVTVMDRERKAHINGLDLAVVVSNKKAERAVCCWNKFNCLQSSSATKEKSQIDEQSRQGSDKLQLHRGTLLTL